ncbi:Protein CHLOROPLAST IMPORT APPARATUS 2 [Camellia lanceoleosa]|uniref:Protein CHLOROPLAST IMPORT APPARATUS 2 n=1 Tax=Camellia lanceoleosa TaxID=1840588 RepID=A0ACC0F6M8_9ERIC|nr:Protein CHLOROPLAST IMPORT APPARATUS 2 [Camellia lanceoleosa]
MGHSSLLRSPKKEEEDVPTTMVPKFSGIVDDKETDIMEELEGILSIKDDEVLPENSTKNMCGGLNWDFMDWEGFSVAGEEEESDQTVAQTSIHFEEESHSHYNYCTVKRESYGFWDDDNHDDEKRRMSLKLNLNLNYQEVLDAWSDRRSLWADDFSLSMANNGYMGEVPVTEEERARREARVLRYKEKRQTRLFSKKIRYQVRKLNADQRPRLKGRFVKRVPEKIQK